MPFIRKATPLSAIFWLLYAAMLAAMFGSRSPLAQNFVTACAALIFLAGVMHLLLHPRRARCVTNVTPVR